MKVYLEPKFEVVDLLNGDVITDSTPGDDSYDNIGYDKNWNFIGE